MWKRPDLEWHKNKFMALAFAQEGFFPSVLLLNKILGTHPIFHIPYLSLRRSISSGESVAMLAYRSGRGELKWRLKVILFFL
jgi:membrane-associated phospholipid phosphatase